jgi:tRNA (guanosine-2'-O-)-methyltransferase
LQDITARLRKTQIDWRLDPIEKQAIYSQWLQKSIKSIGKILQHYDEKIK